MFKTFLKKKKITEFLCKQGLNCFETIKIITKEFVPEVSILLHDLDHLVNDLDPDPSEGLLLHL